MTRANRVDRKSEWAIPTNEMVSVRAQATSWQGPRGEPVAPALVPAPDSTGASGTAPALRGGAPEQFEAVFTELAPYVMRVLPRLGIAPAEVEDVCQEVFVVVHAKLSAFERRSSVRTWVYGICLRVASNYRDRAYRRREQTRDELPLQVDGARQEGDIEQQRTLQRLDAALAQLLPAQREAFVLHAIEELEVTEIAEAQGVSKFTVYARLYAARKHLRTAFPDERAGRRVK